MVRSGSLTTLSSDTLRLAQEDVDFAAGPDSVVLEDQQYTVSLLGHMTWVLNIRVIIIILSSSKTYSRFSDIKCILFSLFCVKYY